MSSSADRVPVALVRSPSASLQPEPVPMERPAGSLQEHDHEREVAVHERKRAILDPLFSWPIIAACLQVLGVL